MPGQLYAAVDRFQQACAQRSAAALDGKESAALIVATAKRQLRRGRAAA